MYQRDDAVMIVTTSPGTVSAMSNDVRPRAALGMCREGLRVRSLSLIGSPIQCCPWSDQGILCRVPKLNFEVRQVQCDPLDQLLVWLVLCWVMHYYHHITKTERLEVGILRNRGYSVSEIAHELSRHRSSIYRELARNTVAGTYQSTKAQHKAYTRRKYSKYQAMSIVGDMKLREYIETRLAVDDWSPEQIAGRLAHEAGLEQVSTPTIYKYIRSPYGRQLEYQLDLARRKRTKKHQQKVTALKDRIFIDKRPEAANARSQYGHWEGDFIVSGKAYGNTSLLVLHERVSRYTLIARIEARTVANVESILIEALPLIGQF